MQLVQKAAILGVVLAGVTVPVLAQFTQERSGFTPGNTDPVDSILARRVTMTTLGRQNDEVHDIIDLKGEAAAADARFRLDNISVFMLGFAEMFPANSYIYSDALAAEDPASVTSALPGVWDDWDDFYTRALVAAETAYQAGRAPTWEQLVELTEVLETQCEACHALYRQELKTIEPDDLGIKP